VQDLRDLLTERNPDVPLDLAALQLAAIEFPHLDVDPHLRNLDALARELAARLPPDCDGAAFVQTANRYLFAELRFAGNEADYYTPRNSCLNEVLERRIGIPITLSIVYMEVARRLGRTVHGIALPGHFLMEYRDPRFACYIDAFHGGKLLTRQDATELAREAAGVDLEGHPEVFRPATNRQILVRMLNNLRAAYSTRRSFAKMIAVLDLLILAAPDSAEEYKQRGLFHLQLRHLAAAAADLTRYRSLAPEAPDREEIEKQIRNIRRWLVTMN
jgi:regulator of sirC expression with transglutaminase-like and TPR domain